MLESKLDRKNFCKRFELNEQKKILALLPGSRKQEIEQIFPDMLGAARRIAAEKDMEIVVGLAPTLEE